MPVFGPGFAALLRRQEVWLNFGSASPWADQAAAQLPRPSHHQYSVRFWKPAVIRCSSYTLLVSLFEEVETLHEHLRGCSFENLRFETGLLIKMVDVISRTLYPSRKMDRLPIEPSPGWDFPPAMTRTLYTSHPSYHSICPLSRCSVGRMRILRIRLPVLCQIDKGPFRLARRLATSCAQQEQATSPLCELVW